MKLPDWIIIFVLCQLFLVSGCVTQKKCAQRYPCPESTHQVDKLIIRDTVIEPADADVRLIKENDSLLAMIRNMRPGDPPIVISDSSGQATIRFWKDLYNRTVIECNSTPQPVPVEKLKSETHQKETVKPVIEYKDKIVYRTPWWNWLLYGVLGILLIQQYARNLIKRLPL